MSEEIYLEKKTGYAIMTINRPKQMNALNTGIVEQIDKLLDEVTLETSFEDDLGADSVDLVELVMAMEEEFEVDEIPEEELTSLKTVGDCVRYLSAKLG